MDRDGAADGPPTAAERERLDAIRTATTLAELVDVTDTDSEHDAYFAAKSEWERLRGRELDAEGLPDCDGTTAADDAAFPGSCVEIDGRRFHVHGVTHAGSDAERAFLQDHVRRYAERDAAVYCEQGIRRLYFSDLDAVCVMDDYRWAMQACRDLAADGSERHVREFDGVSEELDSLTDSFREAAFSLIDAGGEVYGDRFRRALGDVASGLLTSHESVSTGRDFESFTVLRRAAEDPEQLGDLQRYYERAFLPQPLEREWLQRHDPELEIVTHARNERMADYAVTHAADATEVHLIVGAAHQPGVRYYLEQIRDSHRTPTFDPV